MSKELRKIEVVDYNPAWIEQFGYEARHIKEALGSECVAVHHIGSTSIPSLPAKPKIDIIAVVKNHPRKIICKLESVGFAYRGEFNIPMHYGFNKKGEVDVNLHVYQEGHPEIELNLTFRDYIINHPKLREEYAALKLALLKEKSSFEKNGSMFTGYNLGKDRFIRKVLQLSGFDRLRFLKCVHYEEWEAAKKMRQHYFFDKVSIKDPYEWTFNHKDHVHFVLCKGVEIIGYAHMQLWKDLRSAIRIIVVEEKARHHGYGRQFLEWIENWLKGQNYKSIHTEASPDSLLFYKHLGYTLMPFNDPDGYKGDIRDTEMGKAL